MSALEPSTNDCTEFEARRLTERIRIGLAGSWELIIEAYARRAHAALGFASWDAYCDAEFDGCHLKLPRESRQEIVGSLRDAGLSIRAIASAAGISDQTVQRDLKSGVVDHYTSDVPSDDEWQPIPDRVADLEEADPAPAPTITGTDGKNYPAKPAAPPAKPRRKPLPDAADKAAWDIRKAAERIERIAADDRFPAHREQVAAVLRGHLTYAIEVCQDLLDGLDTDPTEDR